MEVNMKKVSMLWFFAILIVGLLTAPSHAAAPAMHVLLGDRWLAHFAPMYQDTEKKLFLLGTVFPDIRYLGVIQRDKTHFKNVTYQKIKNESSPFQRGMLFHSFVDEFREKFIQRTNIEEKIVEVPLRLRGTFLKLVEDQILQDRKNWSYFRNALITIPEEEKKWGISDSTLGEWHMGLTFYFSTFPSLIFMQLGLLDKNILILDAETVKEWSMLIPKYAASKEMQHHVENLIKAFDISFTSS